MSGEANGGAAAAAGKRRRNSLLLNVALVVVAFSLLGFSLWNNRAQIQSVLSRPLDARAFVLAFAVFMAAMLITFVRWYVLVRALGLPFRVRDALRLGFIGNLFNLVIPGAVGGDLIKATYLCREQSRKTQAVASMVIDRAVGLLGLFLVASVSGLVAYSKVDASVQRLITVVWAATVAGLMGLGMIFTPALYRPLFAILKGRGKLELFAHELIDMAATYRSKLHIVGATILMSSCVHSLFVIAFYLVNRALFPNGPTSLLGHYVVVPLSLFSTAIPLPFGALGVSENLTQELFKLFGDTGGGVAMMGYRVLMYAGGIVSAIVYLANIRSVRELRHEAEEAVTAV